MLLTDDITYVDVDDTVFSRLINSTGFTNFVSQYNIVISAALTFVTITVITLFFMNVVRYSHASDNDQTRRMAMNGILVCLVCLAIIGGIDTFYAIVVSLIFGS